MREILFRGKRTDGQWIYGSLLKVTYDGNTYNLIFADNFLFVFGEATAMEHAAVDPSTVGQFTGLTDKNGKKIFEGDIFKMEDEIVAVIIFHEGCFRLQSWGMCGAFTESGYDECGGGWGIIECEPIDWYYIHDMEVIGNIHDNPELLEVEDG